ncbi:MAG: hypothetical protein PQ964_05655 [Methanobacteriaceae archaeon]|jgi:hypothetical protein
MPLSINPPIIDYSTSWKKTAENKDFPSPEHVRMISLHGSALVKNGMKHALLKSKSILNYITTNY